MENSKEVVIYAHEVGLACPVCGEQDYMIDYYDTYCPDAHYLGIFCMNCQTSFPPKPDPGIMDDDDEIPF